MGQSEIRGKSTEHVGHESVKLLKRSVIYKFV